MNKIPNYDECVKYALDMKGIVGETFKDTELRVYERDKANPGTVFTALRKGGIVIPVVSISTWRVQCGGDGHCCHQGQSDNGYGGSICPQVK